jgi:ABC-type Na+ transport system ATPase subunit NatA
MKNSGEFQKIEKLKVEQLNNYDQYGGYGFRLYFMPSPLSILFGSTDLFTELNAHIDVGEKLNIYDSMKGKKLITQKPGRYLDFAGIVLLFGSLMAIIYGYDGFRHKEYLKFLSSLYGHRNIYFSIWLSRTFLLCLYFLIVFVVITTETLLLLMVNDVWLSGNEVGHLVISLILMLLLLVFFLSMGTLAACMKTKLKGLVIFIIWISFVYLGPVGIKEGLSLFIGTILEEIPTNYQSELDKLTILMDFEKEARDKVKDDIKRIEDLKGLVDNPPTELSGLKKLIDLDKRTTLEIEGIEKSGIKKTIEKEILKDLIGMKNRLSVQIEDEKEKVKDLKIFEEWTGAQKEIKKLQTKILETQEKMMEHYKRVKFPEIQAFETKLEDKTRTHIKALQAISIVFPSTFYLAVNYEISSRGYENALEFHQYALKIKEKFFEFYEQKKIEELKARAEGKEFKVESFFEVNKWGLKDVYEGKSRLLKIFLGGLFATFAWIIGVLLLSYSRFRKILFPLPVEKNPELNDLEIDLNKKEATVVLSAREAICEHLYNVLSGKNQEFRGKVIYDEIDLVPKNKRNDFVYLPHPDEIPEDIKVKYFVSFIEDALILSKDQLERFRAALNFEKIGIEGFNNLQEDQKGHVLLEVAKWHNPSIFLIYDFAKGMPHHFKEQFIDLLAEIKEKGTVVLYLTNDLFFGKELGDSMTLLKKDAESMAIKL